MSLFNLQALFRVLPKAIDDYMGVDDVLLLFELVAQLEVKIATRLSARDRDVFWPIKRGYIKMFDLGQHERTDPEVWSTWLEIAEPPKPRDRIDPDDFFDPTRKKFDMDKLVDALLEALVEKMLLAASIVAGGLIVAALIKRFGRKVIPEEYRMEQPNLTEALALIGEVADKQEKMELDVSQRLMDIEAQIATLSSQLTAVVTKIAGV